MNVLHTKIGRRLLGAFLTLTLIPLIAATWLAIESSQAQIHHQTQTTLRAAADGTEAQVLEFLVYLKNRTLDFSSDRFIRDALEKLEHLNAQDPAATQLSTNLSAYLATEKLPLFPEAVEVFLMDRSGDVVASSSPDRAGEDHSQMDYFLEGQWLVFVGDVLRDPRTGEIRWVIAAPITGRTSTTFLGVLASRINPKALSDITTGRRALAQGARSQAGRIGETGETYLVNRNKLMITESRFIDDAVLKVVVDTQPVRRALEWGEEMSGDYPDYRGVPISGASHIIHNTGWVLLTEIDFSQAFEPIQGLRNTLIGLAVGMSLIVLPVTGHLTRRIIKPIERLVKADTVATRGETLESLIPEADIPDDEIGEVMRNRNEMLTRLEAADAELRQQLRDLATLSSAAVLTNEPIVLDDLLRRMLDKVLQITDMDAGQVSLFEAGQRRLVVRAHLGFSADWLRDEADRPTTCLCGKVVLLEEPLGVPDMRQDERTTRVACVREGFCGFHGVPLRADGQVLGVMSLQSRRVRRLSIPKRDLLAAIGSQMAITLLNARLYAEVQHLATTDPLTGLANRRVLQERFDEEMRRARRHNHPFALILADLDHFKRYNDTHGHPAGDMVLRELAVLLQANVRETDLVARYGGEEFALLLCETSGAGALVVAEKIRSAVQSHPFPHGTAQPGGRLTISQGVASFPEDAHTPEELIRCADNALYQAKELGRNRVIGYVPAR